MSTEGHGGGLLELERVGEEGGIATGAERKARPQGGGRDQEKKEGTIMGRVRKQERSREPPQEEHREKGGRTG